LILTEEFHGLAPGGFLSTVEFTEIKHMTLQDTTAHDPAVFDNAPVVMLLAILPAFLAAQKHVSITPLLDMRRNGVGRHYKPFRKSGIVKSRVPEHFMGENS